MDYHIQPDMVNSEEDIMLSLIIIALLVLVVVAWYHTDEKYGATGPAMVIGQVLKWLTFGLLASADAGKVVVEGTKVANAQAALAAAESGQAVDLGIKSGATEYKASELRRDLVSTSKSLRDETKDLKAKLAAVRAAAK